MSVLKVSGKNSLLRWLEHRFILEKLNNPFGYVLLSLFALAMAYVLSVLPLKFSALLLGALVGIPVVIYCFVNLHFGLLTMLTVSFLLGLAAKHTDAPIGTSMDGMLLLMLFGLLVRLVKERDYGFLRSPITWFIVAWIYYNIMEVLNPVAGSRLAWVYTVRSVALLLSLYFIACYALNSLRRILTMTKAIIFLSFVAALYSLKQEFIGYSTAELNWLHADEERFMLIYQWGRLRVFSFFSDPTTFGILMGYMSIFCFIVATGPVKLWQRIALLVSGVCMLMGMAYAGSRTPFALVPLGAIFYIILNFNKKTLIGTSILLVLGAGMVMKSTSNPVMYRIQSAFKPSEDASVHVRLENQRRIQPYIRSHPIGAGLGSTGAWGKRFTPDSWLASFAHDSLYVRLAVETGYIGMLIYMGLLFTAMRLGIYYFFRCADPVIKNLYLAVTSTVFLLAVACYPQEAITLPPTSIIFYIMLGMIVRLKDFDPNFRKAAPQG
ncbi:MAG: O-antigen ligase domain-containing protein [Bacteroidetes bacterium]|nr:MAG: O-antigen ligase domain-containing protein [Bacteroidota bacterium]